MTKSRQIVLLGSLILVVIVLAGWFALLSPRMSKAPDLIEQADAVAVRNEVAQAAINDLETKKANIAQAKVEADALGNRFPPTAEESDLFRLVERAARTAGMSVADITSLAAGVPAIGTSGGAVTLPEEPPAEDTPAQDPADPNAAPAPGTEPVPAPTSQLATMTLDLTVNGSRREIVQFLDALENLDRAYLVTSVSVGSGEGGSSSVTITGNMFLLPELVDPTAPTEQVTPTP